MRRGTKKLTLISLIIFALLGLQAYKNKKLLDKNEKNPTVQTFQAQSNGPQTLGKSPYDYTLWYQGGVKHTLSWYGASQRGGAAFKATWSDSDDFLARVGYSWTNAGEDIKNIGNISCQFSYKKSGEGTAGNYNYIGIYGWIRNETATDPNEKLVEYYIVDDWFGNGGQSEKTPITTAQRKVMCLGHINLTERLIKSSKMLEKTSPLLTEIKLLLNILRLDKVQDKKEPFLFQSILLSGKKWV